MKISRLMVGLAVAGSIGYVTYAYAAGMFNGYPIVGGASFCGGSSNSATGTIIGAITGCPNTVPAGPTALTGTEKIPADTGLSSGINPQTVVVTPAALHALPYSFVAVGGASPANFSATNVQGGVIYESAVTITAANISLPPSAIDNQTFAVCANRSISTLVVGPATGTTFASNTTPSALTTAVTGGPQCYVFLFRLSNTEWYRLQ